MKPGHLLAGAISAEPPAGRFGPYTLIEEIGRGAMGVVFTAQQKGSQRIVAIKFAHGASAGSPDVKRRFRTEAEAVAALDHTGVLPIYEVGEHEGVAFYTMRFAEAGSLAERLDWFREPREAAALVATVADAVQHAHERGILHRDLKPGNILLASRTEPMVGDFGLARWVRRESDLTQEAAVLGTPGYLPPEALRSSREGATIAADVFSLGAILYHVLTGCAPFEGGSVAETLQRVSEASPRAPRSIDENIPRDLEAVCLKCLDREPGRRYRSAGELAGDLRRWLNGEPVAARMASLPEKLWRWSRQRPGLAASLAALVLVIVAAFVLVEASRRSEAAAKARAESASAQLRDALDTAELDRAEDLFHAGESGDGLALLARVARRSPANPVATARLALALWKGDFALPLPPPFPTGSETLRLQFLRDGRTLLVGSARGVATWEAVAGQRLVEFEDDGSPFSHVVLSPDEHTVAAWDDKPEKTLHLFDTATGKRIAPPIPHGRWQHAVAFSPDGARIVAVGDGAYAIVIDVKSGARVGAPLEHEPGIWSVAFSPDGEAIATSAAYHVRWWDSRTQALRRESPRLESDAERVQFSPDGRWLVVACGNGALRFLSNADGRLEGAPMRHESRIRAIAFSADGARMLTTSNDRTARLWSVPGGEPIGAPMRHRDAVSFAGFSPDGARVATCSSDHTTRVWEAATGRPLTQPLRHYEQPGAAAFSPDGATLYASGSDGIVMRSDLRPLAEVAETVRGERMEFDASGRPVVENAAQNSETLRRLGIEPGAPVSTLRLSPDGSTLLAALREPANAARLFDAKTGQPIGRAMAHLDPVLAAEFSPDGRLVGTAGDDHTGRVWDARTGEPVTPPLRHTRTVPAIAFSPDGLRVVTASWDGTARVWDARTGAPLARPLAHGDRVLDARFSPDGRRIATASRDRTVRLWDAATGHPLTEPLRHAAPVVQVRFDPDGQRVIARTKDGARRIWDLPDFSAPAPAWLVPLAEMISLAELPAEPIAAFALIGRYEQTRADAVAETGDGVYARLARRLFPPPGSR